jgi:hypothetical protein
VTRRYEQQMRPHRVDVGGFCDGCGILEADAEFGLTRVIIDVGFGDEGSAVDDLDYCTDCLIARADALVAAGSTAPLVTGVDLPPDGADDE